RALHAKAPYRDAVQDLAAFRIVVGPGQVVLRAGRKDLDRRVTREMLGDDAAVVLGPAGDVEPVPLHDERQVHDFAGTPHALRAESESRRSAVVSCART